MKMQILADGMDLVIDDIYYSLVNNNSASDEVKRLLLNKKIIAINYDGWSSIKLTLE
ncbi:UNVERIFIED_CONTAM: hypothetical protein ABIC26_002606 [Paenibacillus sp. PvR008]